VAGRGAEELVPTGHVRAAQLRWGPRCATALACRLSMSDWATGRGVRSPKRCQVSRALDRQLSLLHAAAARCGGVERSRVSQGLAAGCCRHQAGGRPVHAPPEGRAGGARRQLVFEELLGRAKERAAKEEKRAKRARDDFVAMLRGAKDLDPDAPWEDAKAALAREPEYKAVRARRAAAAPP